MFQRYSIYTALILSVASFIAANGVLGQANMTAQTLVFETEAAKKADAFLAQWEKKDMPGCAVGAMKGNRLVYKRAFGMSNLEYDVPNTDATLFNIASASKPFTAISIALLAEQGKLSLDDDVRKYIPELPQYAETVTIRHLLYHTSGIREYQALVFFGGLSPDDALSDKTVLNMLARQKNISFKPGAKHQYSNSNYHLLGIIVGRVSGKSLREFADENIFKPLGMKNTMFFDNRFEVVKNRASGYRVGADKSIRARASLFDLVGGGGVLTTVEDLSLWMQNFYEPKVGNTELINLLTTAGKLNDGGKINYSFGLFHNKYRGLPVIKHSGNMTGFRAQIVAFPEQKFTALALCNNSAIFPSVIVEKLADIYLDEKLKPNVPDNKMVAETLSPANSISEKDAPRYAGIYASLNSGIIFKLNVKDGKLINNGLAKNESPVLMTSENRLRITADDNRWEMIPVFDNSGAVSEMKMLGKDGQADSFIRVKPPLDSPTALAEYTGTYYSDEFDAHYKLTLKGSSIVFQIGEIFEAPLNAAYADVFITANKQISLTFTRDAQGRIAGFIFNSALDEREVKGIIFKRQ